MKQKSSNPPPPPQATGGRGRTIGTRSTHTPLASEGGWGILHHIFGLDLVPVHVDPSCAQSSQAATLEAGGADPKLSEVLVLGRCWLPIAAVRFLSFTMLYHALPMLLHTYLHTYMWVELVPAHVDPSCAQSSQAVTLEAGNADPKLSEVLVLGKCWLPIAVVRFLSFTMLYHALPMLLLRAMTLHVCILMYSIVFLCK